MRLLLILAAGLASTLVGRAFAATPLAPGEARPAATSDKTMILAIGENRSYEPRLPPLKYAESDLEKFVEVMRSAGLVAPDHIVSVRGGGRAAVLEAEQRLLKEATALGHLHKFIFYFSGHADEGGLHLADAALARNELQDFIASVPADTKVAFVDSCYGGGLASRGVSRGAAFELPKAEYDEPSGTVYLTASSAGELAFESDKLQGGLFTTYLVDGLSGQAEAAGDGLVTVDGLYRYIYRQTRMQGLLYPSAATQTPEFVSHLQGHGAVALSYPKLVGSQLVLAPDLSGRVVVASASGLGLYRMEKARGAAATYRFPAGSYVVSVDGQDGHGHQPVTLLASEARHLSRTDFVWEDLAPVTAARGEAMTLPSSEADRGSWSGLVGVHGGYVPGEQDGPYAAVGRRFAPRWGGLAPTLEAGGQRNAGTELGAAESSVYAHALAGLARAFALTSDDALTGELGLGLGAVWQRQSWSAGALSESYSETMPLASVGAGLAVRVAGSRIGLTARREVVRSRDRVGSSHTLPADLYALEIAW